MTMPLSHDVIAPKVTPNCVARALFDNLAESPDELAFRRGDILTVLEQNTGGSEGWWLCSLRGRQGICPGNRLRLMAGVYDKGGVPPSPPATPTPSCAPSPGPPPSVGYPNHTRRRSWKFQPTKVQLPHRVGDVYLYEQPQSLCSVSPSTCPSHLQGQDSLETYDVPRPPVPINYDTPRNWSRGSPINKETSNDWYDVPRTPVNVLLHQQQMTPSSSASSLTIDSMSSSNRSSLANMPDYDVPKPRASVQLHLMQQNQVYDTPTNRDLPHKELPMEWGKALDMLERLQSEATGAISKLLGFVRPGWRSHTALSPEILDVRLAALRLRAALHDLAEFAEGTLGNAANAHDKSLVIKLRPLVKALYDADRLVDEVTTNLDCINWSANHLCRPEDADGVASLNVTPDSLDQLIACARTLTEDVRQTTSFIQGNSTLLFKKTKANSNKGEWVEEYDYVKLESRATVNKKHAEIREDLPNELKKSFDKVIRDGDYGTTDIKNKPYNLGVDDKQLITFYAVQTITYFKYLTNAIDAFLQTVEKNQPPKVFLAHGKFVVLNTHRLVYIGDTVYKNIENEEIKAKVLKCANSLSDGLAVTVTNTKNAGLQYPSVTAVQNMVDSVVDISHLARDLKHCLILAASQP